MNLEEDQFKEIKNNISFLWILFHTAALKLMTFDDKKVINSLIENVIIPICITHPCLICRNDSITYLESKNNFKNLNNKQELIYELFIFHNAVNAKLKKKEFEFDLLHILYENYNLINVINKIKQVINNENTQIDISFNETIYTAITWLENNIQLFST